MDAQTHYEIHEIWEAIRSIEKQVEKIEAKSSAEKAQTTEEPKAVEPLIGQAYWFLDSNGTVLSDVWVGNNNDKKCFKIGNLFNSKDEAELAVKKLKAWKRLKDAGFKFTEWSVGSGSDHDGEYEGEFVMFSECDKHISKDDLDVLFSDEL